MKSENYEHYDICEVVTIKELVFFNEEEALDDVAFKYIKRKRIIDITYNKLQDEIESLGTYLYMLGIKNINAAILGDNSYEWVLAFLTLVCGNNVAVPIDKNLRALEIIEVIKATKCSVIFYDSSYSDTINEIKDYCKEIKKFIKFNELNSYIKQGKGLLNLGRRDFVFENVKEEDTAVISYSCSVHSKNIGIELSHKNIMTAAASSSRFISLRDMTMCVVPFSHTFAIVIGLIAPLIQKSINVVEPNEKNLIEDLKILQPDSIVAVPLIIQRMYKELCESVKDVKNIRRKINYCNLLLSHGIDFRQRLSKYTQEVFGGCLEYIICGESIIDENQAKIFRAFGIEVLNSYGLPESSSLFSINRNEDNKLDSVGQVIPNCDLRITEEGEILIKGNMIMKGYYRDDELTKQSFKNGWFKTGDIGYLDKDGFLYIVERKKNIIVRDSGEVIFPKYIEDNILKIPGVKDVMVYEEDKKIVAEVLPDYKFLKLNESLNIGHYIRNEVKCFNKHLAKYKKVERVIIREKEFSNLPFFKINKYNRLNIK